MAANIVAVDNHTNPRMVQIHLKKSKCDQFGQGADMIVGVTCTDVCPITALCQYLHIMGSTQGPFFLDAEGKVLTKSVVVHGTCYNQVFKHTSTRDIACG